MFFLQKDGTVIIINKYDCKNDDIYYKKIYELVLQMTK